MQGFFDKKKSKSILNFKAKSVSKEAFRRTCPLIPSNLNRRVKVNTMSSNLKKLETYLEYLFIRNGGENSPKTCIPRSRVAIIVPYRNRENILVAFLRHIHPFLIHQQIVIFFS